jgi:hypothetical protein
MAAIFFGLVLEQTCVVNLAIQNDEYVGIGASAKLVTSVNVHVVCGFQGYNKN